MPNFSILLPPSEDTQPGGNPYAPDMFDYRTSNTFNYFNELNPERRKLIAAMQQAIADGEDAEEMFGRSGEKLDRLLEINAEIYNAPLMSALDRFSPGIMYSAMDFAGLPTGAQRRLLENGIIFSGLFGLLRPDDLIPDHFLPMEADVPEIGSVFDFWRPVISPVLNRAVSGAFVWNFLPNRLAEAWDNDKTYENIVRTKFYTRKSGKDSEVTENLPVLEGKLVNFIVRESLEEIEPLNEWKHPEGYVFDPEVTKEDEETKEIELAFVKKG